MPLRGNPPQRRDQHRPNPTTRPTEFTERRPNPDDTLDISDENIVDYTNLREREHERIQDLKDAVNERHAKQTEEDEAERAAKRKEIEAIKKARIEAYEHRLDALQQETATRTADNPRPRGLSPAERAIKLQTYIEALNATFAPLLDRLTQPRNQDTVPIDIVPAVILDPPRQEHTILHIRTPESQDRETDEIEDHSHQEREHVYDRLRDSIQDLRTDRRLADRYVQPWLYRIRRYIRYKIMHAPWLKWVHECTVVNVSRTRHICTVVCPDRFLDPLPNVAYYPASRPPKIGNTYVLHWPVLLPDVAPEQDTELRLEPPAYIKVPHAAWRWVYWLNTVQAQPGKHALWRVAWPPKAVEDSQGEPNFTSWEDAELMNDNIPFSWSLVGSATPDEQQDTMIVFADNSDTQGDWPRGSDPTTHTDGSKIKQTRFYYIKDLGLGEADAPYTSFIPTPLTAKAAGWSNYGNSFAGVDYAFINGVDNFGASFGPPFTSVQMGHISCHFHSDAFDPPLDDTIETDTFCTYQTLGSSSVPSYLLDIIDIWAARNAPAMGLIAERNGNAYGYVDDTLTSVDIHCPVVVGGSCIWNPSAGHAEWFEFFTEDTIIQSGIVGTVTQLAAFYAFPQGLTGQAWQYGGIDAPVDACTALIVQDDILAQIPPPFGGHGPFGFSSSSIIILGSLMNGSRMESPSGMTRAGGAILRLRPNSSKLLVIAQYQNTSGTISKWYKNAPGETSLREIVGVQAVNLVSIDGWDMLCNSYTKFSIDYGDHLLTCTTPPWISQGGVTSPIFVDDASGPNAVPEQPTM